MLARFFIQRPVFTSVCSLIIVFLGLIVIPTLPVAQFPNISPVQVIVTSNYAGADAQTVESAVTNLVEQEINGVEGMKYISSSSGSDGTSQVTVTFNAGENPDIATVNVQNRVARAQPRLPGSVVQTGVTVSQENTNFLMAVAIYSENDEYEPLFLSNYASLFMVDALRRVEGVGGIQIFGERKYAMRLWLDPNRLAARSLTVQDVEQAIREQNVQVGAGQIGQQPAPDGQEYQLSLRAESRLSTVQDFEELVLSTGQGGKLVKLKDVGRVELGAENYGSGLTYNGIECVGLGITQRPGTNALRAAEAIRAEFERLSQAFPPGMQYAIAFDTTVFVDESLRDVVNTLVESVVLVVLVIFLFLQDWRTTLIPGITIPVALLGTFIFTRLFGFSINTLTLFGLTLATGIVVDDAIVVVEAIATKVQDQGMNSFRAAVEAMQELTGAVIATSLVLMALFIPVAFFPGTTGSIYQQFALTIAFSIALSTFNALTLSPMLGAVLMNNMQGGDQGWLGRLFAPFNRFQHYTRERYADFLHLIARFKYLMLAVFAAMVALTVWVYQMVPSAFLPEEDQGYFITIVQAPEGVSLNYTQSIMARADQMVRDIPEVESNFSVAGFSFAGVAPNQGIMFTLLKPWGERRSPDQSVQALIGKAQMNFFGITEARIFALNPPSIQGLGNFGGFQMEMQDRRNLPLDVFVGNLFPFLGAANQNPNVAGVFSTYSANTPQLLVQVNRDRAKALNVDIQDIFDTLQSFLGSSYVNDFNLDQRAYRVYVQADQQFRSNPEAINQFYVRSATNQMIPLSNLVSVTPTTGPQTITHYNLFRSISIQGAAAQGRSSGQAIAAMEETAAQVFPPGIGFEWTGTALEEQESGGQAPIIFGIGLIMVFLVLAAQYESYIDPTIIMLTVPLAILGALAAQFLRGLANDVYCQIGLLMLIGLASKNTILIVEYANQLREQGYKITEAAIEASRERLRPILMTAFSGLVGFLPLMLATGAGAASRQSLGTAVFGGYLVATFLSLFITPILYIIIKQGSDRFFPPREPESTPDTDTTLPSMSPLR